MSVQSFIEIQPVIKVFWCVLKLWTNQEANSAIVIVPHHNHLFVIYRKVNKSINTLTFVITLNGLILWP